MSKIESEDFVISSTEPHTLIVEIKIKLDVHCIDDYCFYTSERNFNVDSHYYRRYCEKMGWKIYYANCTNVHANIDNLIEMRKSILNKEKIFIALDKSPYCDEYLTFYNIVKDNKEYRDKTLYSRPLSLYFIQEYSIHDAYSINDELLKNIFLVKLKRDKDTNKFNRYHIPIHHIFKFHSVIIHQEIIIYINLERLIRMYNLQNVNRWDTPGLYYVYDSKTDLTEINDILVHVFSNPGTIISHYLKETIEYNRMEVEEMLKNN